jgi:hypothetical protein
MTRCDFGLILGFLALLTMFSPLLIARWEARGKQITQRKNAQPARDVLAPAPG